MFADKFWQEKGEQGEKGGLVPAEEVKKETERKNEDTGRKKENAGRREEEDERYRSLSELESIPSYLQETNSNEGYCTVLYCTVLYCTVLYCTVLYCTVLYCTVLYSIGCCIVCYYWLLYRVVYTILWSTDISVNRSSGIVDTNNLNKKIYQGRPSLLS